MSDAKKLKELEKENAELKKQGDENAFLKNALNDFNLTCIIEKFHARALLLCDASQDGPAWKVTDVAEVLGITSRTIEH